VGSYLKENTKVVLVFIYHTEVIDMKIIEQNNRIECKCGCVFEYDENDVKEENRVIGRIILQDEMYCISYVKCPVCGKKHRLFSEFKGYC
jgi:hypothetical protein